MRTSLIAGFTLVEVLVAILVLAVGVLGAAGAQVAALRARHASALLSNGVQLAAGLADRMRANTVYAHGPDALNPYLQLQYDAAADGAPAAGPACFDAGACAHAELAAFDMGEVRRALHRGFPGGRVAVCRDGGAAAAQWACSAGAGAPLLIKLGWLRRQADGQWRATPAVVMVVAGGGA